MLALTIWVCITGCQAVVNFDRSLLIDAGPDAGTTPDAGLDADAGPDGDAP